jgi:hypothetical protein
MKKLDDAGSQGDSIRDAPARETTYHDVVGAALAICRRHELREKTVSETAGAWLRFRSKTMKDEVGDDFGEGFHEQCGAFLLQLVPYNRPNVYIKREGLMLLRAACLDVSGASIEPEAAADIPTYADLLGAVRLELSTEVARRGAIYFWLERNNLPVQSAVGTELLDEETFKAGLDRLLPLGKGARREKSNIYKRRGSLKSVRDIAVLLSAGKSRAEAIVGARKEPTGAPRAKVRHAAALKTRMPSYGQLRQDLSSGPSSRNNLAALNDWLAFHQLSDHSPIGPELLADEPFNAALLEITKSIENDGSLKNKKSAFRSVRGAGAARVPTIPKATLPEAIKDALKRIGIPIHAAQRKYGYGIQMWVYRGKTPTSEKSQRVLQQLATDAGLPADHFAGYILSTKKRKKKGGGNDWSKDVPRWSAKPYAMNRISTPALPPTIQRWADAYATHKKLLGQWNSNEEGHFASESAFRRELEEFYGYLHLASDAEDPDLRGKGMPYSALTFPMFVDANFVEELFKFRNVRGRRDFHAEGLLARLDLRLPLVHPRHGFLWREPEAFLPDLAYLGSEQPFDSEGFTAWCIKQHTDLLKLRSKIEKDPKTRMTRDPNTLLSDILDREQPLTFVRDLLANMEADRPPANAPEVVRAKHEADIALVALWTACPLRVYNMCIARRGRQLHRRSDGWWFREYRRNFKTRMFHKNRPYWEMRIAEPFQHYIEDYMEGWVKALPGFEAGSPFVWVNQADKNPARLTERGLACRMQMITATYGGIRLNCQWIRHVVATDYILNQPGSFIVAAFVLNDSLETVLKSYAHLVAKAMNRHYPRYLEQIFPCRTVRRNTSQAPAFPMLIGNL